MNLFEAVKAAVTPRMAAERYGLPVRQGNMVCCPFHADRTPSMKLNEEYFYCFGCGASGDVIDLAARLFGLSSYDAAKKLAADFSITGQKPSILARLQRGASQAETERRCLRAGGLPANLAGLEDELCPAIAGGRHRPALCGVLPYARSHREYAGHSGLQHAAGARRGGGRLAEGRAAHADGGTKPADQGGIIWNEMINVFVEAERNIKSNI